MIFFLIFLMVPLLEIALFMGVGGEIGVLKTLLLCLITALIGGFLVRTQGIDTLLKGQKTLSEGQLPLDQIFDGFCLVIAGALLLTPGFFTDIIGFSLLVPQIRAMLKHYASKRMQVYSGARTPTTEQPTQKSDVVEGEYKRLDDAK